MRAEHKSGRDTWLTPTDILDRARRWMGEIDLDPCSNSLDHSHVPARVQYTKEIDGLSRSWARLDGSASTVFMNPPYNKQQDQRRFVRKVLDEFNQGHIARATLLLAARTDTQWHSWLAIFPRCYVQGRLCFLDPETREPFTWSAPFPSVIFGMSSLGYYGAFVDAFLPLGEIYVRYI